jgi:hypothetical protein
MEFGRVKLLASFALFGFIIGVAAFYIFDWFAITGIVQPAPLVLAELAASPWFASGVVGSILSVIIVYAFAHFAADA